MAPTVPHFTLAECLPASKGHDNHPPKPGPPPHAHETNESLLCHGVFTYQRLNHRSSRVAETSVFVALLVE